MKVILVQNHDFGRLNKFSLENGQIQSACMRIPLREEKFQSAHANCENCETFCRKVKGCIQLSACDIPDDNYMEINFSFDPTTMTTCIKVEGDILKTMSQKLRFDECVWLKVHLYNLGLGGPSCNSNSKLESISSPKLDWNISHHRFEGKMCCLEDWRMFWLSAHSIHVYGKLNVILGQDAEDLLKADKAKIADIACIAKTILTSQASSDTMIIASDGSLIPCNKCFLEVQSPVIASMLKNKEFVDQQENVIKLGELSASGVHALLEYIYCRLTIKANLNSKTAIELLICGSTYEIDGLEEAMQNILLQQPKEWFHVSAALRFFYYACRKEVQRDILQKATQIIKAKPKEEIAEAKEYETLFFKTPQAFQKLLRALACDE